MVCLFYKKENMTAMRERRERLTAHLSAVTVSGRPPAGLHAVVALGAAGAAAVHTAAQSDGDIQYVGGLETSLLFLTI